MRRPDSLRHIKAICLAGNATDCGDAAMLVEPRPGPVRHAGAAPAIGMACGQAPVQLDVLMERIRAELRARQHRTGADRRLPDGTGSRDARVRPVVLTWLALPEREFIHAAYIAVLGRQPDPDGQASIMY